MLNRVLVAFDISGSTKNSSFYHSTAKRNLPSPDQPFDVILWSTIIRESSPEQLSKINDQMYGQGGTNPRLIADYLINHKEYQTLIIITDGQIPEKYVKELDDILTENQLQLEQVDCILIQTSKEKMDATVIAPFLRRFPFKVTLFIEGKEPECLASRSSTDSEFIKKIQSISTIEEFETKYDDIFSDVKNKMLGISTDITLRDEILKLRFRLMNQMKEPPLIPEYEQLIASFADSGNIENMIEFSQIINTNFHKRFNSITWPPKLFHLLRMCSGNLGSVFSLSALSSNFNADRVRRSDVVQSFEINEVPIFGENSISDLNDQLPKFTCPISYEEEKDIILLISEPEQSLLRGIHSDLINSMVNSPFNAIKYPKILKKIANHLDHPLSLRSMQESEKMGFPISISPLTRRPLIGGLCLSPCEEHCKVTNHTLSLLLSDGKQAGNIDQWFAVIWYIVETDMVPYLKEILPQIRSHLVFRFKNHFGTMTLLNIPYYNITRVPLGISCWFALCGSVCGMSLTQAYEHFKPLMDQFGIIFKICKLLNYSIPAKATELLGIMYAFSFLEEAIKKNNREIIPHLIKIAYRTIDIDRSSIRKLRFQNNSSIIILDGSEPSFEEAKDSFDFLPIFFQKIEHKCEKKYR